MLLGYRHVEAVDDSMIVDGLRVLFYFIIIAYSVYQYTHLETPCSRSR